jgi:hypothetical protein
MQAISPKHCIFISQNKEGDLPRFMRIRFVCSGPCSPQDVLLMVPALAAELVDAYKGTRM